MFYGKKHGDEPEDIITIITNTLIKVVIILIFKDHGYNWIRLRLFHTHDRLPNNLEYTVALAKEAKKIGYKFLLNYHYSDTWADPAKQFIPKAWEAKTHKELF